MSDKDIEMLIELANVKLEDAKHMTKREAILSLNRAGILTKKGKFVKAYSEISAFVGLVTYKPNTAIKND